MKNLIKKSTVRTLFSLLLLLLSANLIAQTTITSTSSGGKWNDVTTWIGGQVPTASHDVVINGQVDLNMTASCKNITINSSGSLDVPSWYYTLTISGNIINNGRLSDNPSSSNLYLNISGNITNNGIWALRETKLAGNSNQLFSQTEGKKFEGKFVKTNTTGSIVLDSDVTFIDNTWELNGAQILTNGYKLTIQNFNLNNGVIQSDDTMNLHHTTISKMIFNGNYTLEGTIDISSGNVFNGNVTILDSLRNIKSWYYTLTVNGNITNNGVVSTNPHGSSFYLDIAGNIVNNGVWAPRETRLTSNSDQLLSQGEGRFFEGKFMKNDTLGAVVLASDVMFKENTWELNGAWLRTNGFKLTTQDYNLRNGVIQSDDTMNLHHTSLYKMIFNGNYKLEGTVDITGGNVFNGNVTILDSLRNIKSWYYTLTVNGNITNNGVVSTNPHGNSFYLDIAGNIVNNGVWAPRETRLTSTSDQLLSQGEGRSFEGKFVKNDTLGAVVLESDVTFSGNTWEFNGARLRTNGFKLTASNFYLSRGIIHSNDTINLDQSTINVMTFNGDYKLEGKTVITSNSNTFNGKVTILDSLHNISSWYYTLNINGDLVNNGVISNNPAGQRLYLNVACNIENNNLLNVSQIYFTGTGERTITGSRGKSIQADFYVDDAIEFTGDILLPNLQFTSNPEAGCTVKEGAVLTVLKAVSNASKISNYGRVGIEQEMNNTSNKTYTYFAASASVPGNPEFMKLTIDNYGYQQHPTATGTINTWWRLRNSPATYNDSLNWLKLNYPEDALNGANEDSIMVFHSPNSGLSWKRIRTDYSVDKEKNEVTINKAPSWGHYLLSSSALGITSFQPLVESAEPRFGGNSGQLTMYLFGAGFKNTSIIKLQRQGQPAIMADTTMITDGFGESMLARFNLKNQSLGKYDVVVETPNEKTITLTDYFTIELGERSDPWSAIAGRNRFLLNRWSTFNLSYGNTANTDALGTILVYVVNDLPGLEVKFPDVNIIMPKTLVDMGPDFTRFRDSLDMYYVSDSLSGYEGQNMRIYPFYIPYIAAGSSNSVRVRVKLTGTGSLSMDSWILDPLYEVIDYNLKSADPMPAEVRACITAAAMKAWYGGMVSMGASVVPGLACWSIIDKTVDPIGYITPEELKPEGKQTWGSWFWSGVSVMGSAVQCGASFVPGIGTAVSLGISMVNTTIDMKDGYDATEGCWRKFRKKSQSKLNSNGVTSFDPNEKAGPQGFTADRYISGEGNLNYTIFFENLPTAGASALEVFITDTLDVTKFDFNTFSFHTVAFADTAIKIQEYAKEFQVLVDLYPQKNIIVQIHGNLDTITGIVKWDFYSLDRQTLELTEDPDGGFLPPNKVSPEGEGHVTFSCKLKPSVEHDDLISNRASIVFDLNKPIITNTFTNRIDDRLPESTIVPLALAQEDSVFTVSWTGSDQGSQIENYNIFVSVNDSAYVLWKVAKTAGSAEFIGKDKYQYRFFSVATDSIGFAEPYKTSAEAVTVVDVNTGSGLTGNVFAEIKVYPNPADQYCTVALNMKIPGVVEILLHDITGRTTYRKTKDFWPSGLQRTHLDLKNIPHGLYLVQVKEGENSHYIKLIKRAE